jgi:hypothetical protein
VKIVAVAGSGSGCGKTSVICGLLRAIPGLGAVKISPREGSLTVEWGPGGSGKDTALYNAAGAAQVARIVGSRGRVPEAWETVRTSLVECRGIIVEGSAALDLPDPKRIVFVVGGSGACARPERAKRIAQVADWIVLNRIPRDQEDCIQEEIVAHARTGVPVLVPGDLIPGDPGFLALADAVRLFMDHPPTHSSH